MTHVQLDRDAAIAAAEAFVPELMERGEEIENNRFVPHDLSQRLKEAGLYFLCVPKMYGGSELDPETMVRVVETLSRGDGATGWCIFIGATSGVFAGYLPEAVSKEIFSNPLAALSGAYAPTGVAVKEDGGYRVKGRWKWGSGGRNATWMAGGCLVEGEVLADGTPNPRLVLIPASDAEILDTWDVSGLCGTGSNDFVFDDLFVPEEYTVPLFGAKRHPSLDYVFPISGYLSTGISGVVLGLAQASIDEFIKEATGKARFAGRTPLIEQQATHLDLARAHSLVQAARSYLFETLRAAHSSARVDGDLHIDHQRDIRLATVFAVTSSVEAVDLMYHRAGGNSVWKSSRLQRIFRDIHVATQHIHASPSQTEICGSLLAGLETNTTGLVL